MQEPGQQTEQPARWPTWPTRRMAVVGLVAALVLVLAALGATSSWGPVVEVLPVPPRTVAPSPLPTPSQEETPLPDSLPLDQIEPWFQPPEWLGELLRVLVALVVGGFVLWFLVRLLRAIQGQDLRRAGAASGTAVEIPDIDEEEVEASLSETIASLRAGVAVDDAVVECWRKLEGIAAKSGITRGRAQTSQEYTVEILGHAVVDDSALAELADLYRAAMFSTHVLTDADRDRAIACLERLADQLTGVRDDAR